MSDKSRDAEPEREDLVAGQPDAAEPTEAELVEDDSLSIDDIEDPEALAAAEEAVIKDDEAAASDPATDGELVDATDADAASDDEAIAELEENFTPEEQAAAAAAPIVRKTAKAPVRKKDAPTRKRSEATSEHEDPYKAKNPVQFVKQSVDELKKVVWPTWAQTLAMFGAVLTFVLIMIAIVGVLDFAFGWGLLKLFGSN
ncbi:preprotein translocase subunit SecE [Tessaracoccus flavescens]|uniref:preprotein translocase subunit SecE n=1 Tax=Tessaracoccus flavescens TaxID=399497 RepID=UPI001F01F1A4|nr:preprotein translocase subunit SecE [Tessaracoccus flavescens]